MSEGDARLRRAEHLFWIKSTRYLRTGEYRDLSHLWADCLKEAGIDGDGYEMLAAPENGLVTETKSLPVWALEIKENADGTIEGYGAAYSKDQANDIIVPGAFKQTLEYARAYQRAKGRASLLPMLWQHDKTDPIGGVLSAKEDIHGLRATFRINRDIPHGQQAYDGLKNGYLAFSIGYRPEKFEWRGSTRYLKQIGLAEISAVTFPCNPDAVPVNH